MVIGNGGGAAFKKPSRGDRHAYFVSYLLSGVTFCIYRCSLIWLCCRYEGEFYAGFPHGLGVYTAANGQTYRGEWAFGKKHG